MLMAQRTESTGLTKPTPDTRQSPHCSEARNIKPKQRAGLKKNPVSTDESSLKTQWMKRQRDTLGAIHRSQPNAGNSE
jgi:hypothetical protein